MPSHLSSAFKSPRAAAEYIKAYDATMRLWPIPYESLSLASRFGSTHVVACGPAEAPPLVLLHSFFTSLTIWAYNVEALSKIRRLYAVDMMGQPSRSIPDEAIADREDMAEWLTSILDALRLERSDLCGYSYGGFAALNYAIKRPDRVDKLVLLSPVGGLMRPRAQFYVRGMLTRLPGSFGAQSMMRWFFYKPNLGQRNTRRMFDLISSQMLLGIKQFRMSKMVLPTRFSEEELRTIESPTLLLIGQQESLYNPTQGLTRGTRLIPDIEAALLPRAAHDMPVSQPTTVNERIVTFLNRTA